MVRCGWVIVAVGSQLGYLSHPGKPPKYGLPAKTPALPQEISSVVRRRGWQFVEHVGDPIQDVAERSGQFGRAFHRSASIPPKPLSEELLLSESAWAWAGVCRSDRLRTPNYAKMSAHICCPCGIDTGHGVVADGL